MSMIKEAMEHVEQLAKPELIEACDRQYSTKPLVPVKDPVPETLTVHTLTGLVDFVQQSTDVLEGDLLVQVVDHECVKLLGWLDGDFKVRPCFVKADRGERAGFRFGQYLDQQSFVTGLQAFFTLDAQLITVLAVVGNIKEEDVRTSQDDGVTQTVTGHKGTALREEVELPSPVSLRPFRTFAEIEQPPSRFVLRARSGDGSPELALFEVTDGSWRLEAIHGIRDYLRAALGAAIPIIA